MHPKLTLLRRCTGRTFKWPKIKKKHATFLNFINFAESKFKKGLFVHWVGNSHDPIQGRFIAGRNWEMFRKKNYQNSRFLKIHQVKQKIRKKFVFCTLTKPFGAYCQWSALHWPKYKWILSTWKISDLKNQQIKAKIVTRKWTPSCKNVYSNNNKRCLKFEFKNLRKCWLPLLFCL